MFTNKILQRSVSLLFGLSLISASILWLKNKGFKHRDLVSKNKFHTFFKGWMMLTMGNGLEELGEGFFTTSVVAMESLLKSTLGLPAQVDLITERVTSLCWLCGLV